MNKDERVVRKLTSTLALFYISTDGLEGCISRLSFSCLGLDSSSIGEKQNIRMLDKTALSAIDERCLVMILWFMSALAEESGKKLSVSEAA